MTSSDITIALVFGSVTGLIPFQIGAFFERVYWYHLLRTFADNSDPTTACRVEGFLERRRKRSPRMFLLVELVGRPTLRGMGDGEEGKREEGEDRGEAD